MIKANHLFVAILFSVLCLSCSTKSNNSNIAKSEPIKTNNDKKYILNIYQDKINSAGNKFEPDNRTDTLAAVNDTVAYLTALKVFYNKKIIERKQFNYGQPKSFTIIDTNGVDLTAKLSDRIVIGLKNQVQNMPDVRKMIEEYRKDSL